MIAALVVKGTKLGAARSQSQRPDTRLCHPVSRASPHRPSLQISSMASSTTPSSSALSLTPSSSPSPSLSPSPEAVAQLPPAESFDESGDLQLLVGTEGPDQARFIVCSRALSRLSPVFKSMLAASPAERCPEGIRDAWTVKLPEDDPESVRIALALAHGSLHKVPRHMSLDSLYRLCTCIDRYDISEALKPWVSGWCAGDKSQRSAETGAEARAKELWISWVLGNSEMHQKAAQILFFETQSSEVAAEGPLDPTGVVGKWPWFRSLPRTQLD